MLILPQRRAYISNFSAITDLALEIVYILDEIQLAIFLFTKTETKSSVLFAVHGGFSQWSAWRSCSVTCGKGIQKRSRQCNSPSPANGGKPCQGSDSEMRNCHNKLCPGIPLYSADRRVSVDTHVCSLAMNCPSVSTFS